MPTTLRTFPRQVRSGTQETGYAQLPAQFTAIQLLGDATAAVLSDTANAVRFEVLHSPTGSDADARVIQVDEWYGGTYTPKRTSTPVPRPVDLTFAPIPAGGFIALRATFRDATTFASRAIDMGASLIGLP